jgi:exopolysaccharide production protein ExoQ
MPTNKSLATFERWFVILSVIFYSSGPLPLLLAGGSGQGIDEDNAPAIDYTMLQSVFFLNYLISLFLLIIRWKKATYTLSKDWTIWLLMIITVASVFWSFTPQVTRARSIALVGTSLFGLYIASRYTIREQIKLLGWSFILIIIMSFLFAILLPHYGTMDAGVHTGSWRGIYVHKNVFGKVIGIGGIVFMLLVMDGKEKWWFSWLGLVLSFCLLFLSRSSSSMINFLTVIALIPVYRVLRLQYYLMIPILIAIVTIGGGLSLWLNQNAGILLGSIGKDPTLTGRTDMWPQIMDMIWKEPWLGYGYNAFWNDWNSPCAYVWYAVKWTPPNSHNGFLDLWLDLGLLGVVVFGIGFSLTIVRGLYSLRTKEYWMNFWGILYLTYLVLCNLTESSLVIRNDIFWLLYITASFSLAIYTPQVDKISVQN